jgi:hypothetical protein
VWHLDSLSIVIRVGGQVFPRWALEEKDERKRVTLFVAGEGLNSCTSKFTV